MSYLLVDYTKWISKILAVAWEASEAIREIYEGRTFEVKSKTDHSPVTEADLISHHIIEKGLQALDPSIPVLSEEGNLVTYATRSSWNRFWLVDPLDGTREFIRGTQEFTVNIALIEEHEAVLGVVVAPLLGQSYWAVKGQNAYFKALKGKPTIIHSNKIPNEPIKIAISRESKKSDQDWLNLLARLKEYNLVYCGSALKICLVANGAADLYPRFGSTSEWDTAAGQCILESAGGCLVNLSGHPLRYNTGPSLINPYFFALGSSKLIGICCG